MDIFYKRTEEHDGKLGAKFAQSSMDLTSVQNFVSERLGSPGVGQRGEDVRSGVTNTPGYDALGRVASSTDGRGNATTFLYNALGQRICAIDAATNATWYAFDAFGRMASTTNALGEATVYEYNLQGRKTYEGGGTYPVRFTYDDEGRMTGMTTYRDESGPGDTTAWTYDPVTGLLVQKLYDDGKGPSYTYTSDGKLASRTWARGVTTTYAYDGWGNLTNIVHSDGTPSISMAYDVMGRQIQTSDAAGVTTFAYDAFSSLTNETVAGQYAKALDRHVDGHGRNVGYSLDGQRKQTVAYDPATGRIASMDGFAWQYLPGTDLKQSLAYPNGAVAEWVYEPQRDLLTLVSNDVFSAYAYENDAAGRRISKNTERYGYNNRGELIAATNTVTAAHYAYTFDSIGNRIVAEELGTNISYSANALNQYTKIVAEAPFIPEFDDDGNQTLVKTSTGIWHITYNAENRPVVWSNETAVVTMDFDRMGRRVWYRSISGAQTNAYAKFVYDGYLCVQQLDGLTGTVEQEFVWDPTETLATRPLVWTLPGLGHTFFYFHDGNKNVSDVIDADSAALAAHYEYAPFGAVTAATGPFAAVNPYRFSSEYHDPDIGCVYYNYRHYNPLDGRWTSRDPIGESGDWAVYQFLINSSLVSIDYLGLMRSNPPGSSVSKLPCCGSTPYDPKKQCCCPKTIVEIPDDGPIVTKEELIVVERTPIKSGVVTYIWRGPNAMWHHWITWPGGSADSNATFLLHPPGDRTVRTPAMGMSSDGTPTDVMLSPCSYDFSKLRSCLSRVANELAGKPGLGGLCDEFVRNILEKCKNESSGCTVP